MRAAARPIPPRVGHTYKKTGHIPFVIVKISLDAAKKIAYNMGHTKQEVADMTYRAAHTHNAAVKCAHSAPCRVSIGFFTCSALFSALHFFGVSFFARRREPLGACV